MFKVPHCQNKIRARDGSLIGCPYRAHWVVYDTSGAAHHLICKLCGLRCSGVDLVAIKYVVHTFARITAEPVWPPRFEWPPEWMRGPVREPEQPKPRSHSCLVCEAEVVTGQWCADCQLWVDGQTRLGKHVLHLLAWRLDAHRLEAVNLRTLRAEPWRLRAIDGIGPKSAQWLLEVELPVRERV